MGSKHLYVSSTYPARPADLVVTLKHLRLAAFAGAEHADKPWAERLRLWNTSFPEWHYAQESTFRRDAIRAEARILYPGRYRGSTPLRERHHNEATEGN